MERWLNLLRCDYAVSDHGRIMRTFDKPGTWAGRILAPSTGKLGYPRVILCSGGKEETLFIHQAVAEYFVGPRPVGMVVDHIDGSRDNNHYLNLQYISHAENIRKGYVGKTGTNHHSAKLTDQQVAEIFVRRKNGERGCDLAVEFHVSQQTICDISKQRSRSPGVK